MSMGIAVDGVACLERHLEDSWLTDDSIVSAVSHY